MNEGHSAFLAIERLRTLVAEGMPTAEALEHVRRTSVFTTHTPVPAGNEVFDEELVGRYVGRSPSAAGLDARGSARARPLRRRAPASG